jgi:hypothetical protein
MFVSGEAWRFFKEAHPEQDFSDFGLKFHLNFPWIASIFLRFPSSRRREPDCYEFKLFEAREDGAP